jgi:hypothetical protein
MMKEWNVEGGKEILALAFHLLLSTFHCIEKQKEGDSICRPPLVF